MLRRHLLAGTSAMAAWLMTGCREQHPSPMQASPMPRSPRYPSIPPLSGTPADPARIHQRLEELRLSYEAIGEAVSADLQPPISHEALAAQCSWFPGEIAEEIYALYAWRGGQLERDDEPAPSALFWFRDRIFSTPDIARHEYQSMMETYGPYNSPEMSGVDLKSCFPFASLYGGWYVFPCGGQAIDPAHPRAIINVFQGVDIYFHSLESMLQTCIEWVRHPQYRSRDAAWDHLEIDIWQKNNPGLFERS